MLDWLPLPKNFVAQFREATGAPIHERVERLIELCQYRVGFLESIQINRVLDGLTTDDISSLQRARIAILGSATMEHLIPAIRVAALRRRFWIDVYCGGYGRYRQEVLDPASGLWSFQPDTIVFSIAAAHAIPTVSPNAGAAEVTTKVDSAIGEFTSLWRRARQDLKAAIIHQTFLTTSEPLFGGLDRLVAASPWSIVKRMNDALSQAATNDGVLLLDIARASERDGLDAWFDVTRMLQAKQEIAPHAAPKFGELLVRIIAAQRGMSKKCLVLDLDNTLWGGVLGDDGVQGLVLGHGSAAGEAYLDVQRYARELKDRGILLAVCSKNDPGLAADAFASHPEMILRRTDIAAFVANWRDKAENLVAIARQLNIGLDSLVFLDDNPAERERVRQALPSVAVPEMPDDIAGYVRRIAEAGYFEAVSFTEDDQQRAAHYSHNAMRDALLQTAQSMDEFLQGLQMSVEYGTFSPVDLPRVTQLINKTNQFTPTTRRYSAEQIASLASVAGSITLQFRLSDRFGDNGLVCAMILCPLDDEPDRLEIDTWVVSCRVFGRQLEHEVMNIAVETARRGGARSLVASYFPTPKNGVIRDLYPMLGFKIADSPGQNPGSTRWSLQLSEYTPFVTQIARRVSQL